MDEMPLGFVQYEDQDRQASWLGMSFHSDDLFSSFMRNEVTERLHDEQGTQELISCLRGLATTGFGQNNLESLLAAEVVEERSWAIGEAIAEAYLEHSYDVAWPWNMERDKRNPTASLPGADLIGFVNKHETTMLVLGEVKTSSDGNVPPNVVYGRSGVTYQIDKLAEDLGLIFQLLKWLLPRCKGTEYETKFKSAIEFFLNSGNKALSLFGILIRDTEPNEKDLLSRGHHFGSILEDPTTCQLIALYMPCTIDELPTFVTGEAS